MTTAIVSTWTIIRRLVAFAIILPFRIMAMIPGELRFWADVIKKRRVNNG
jgi:hypothetical protein